MTLKAPFLLKCIQTASHPLRNMGERDTRPRPVRAVLHLLGFDPERFSYKFQGLDQRLIGVEPARVVTEILA